MMIICMYGYGHYDLLTFRNEPTRATKAFYLTEHETSYCLIVGR